jgi:hypothetical protein
MAELLMYLMMLLVDVNPFGEVTSMIWIEAPIGTGAGAYQ